MFWLVIRRLAIAWAVGSALILALQAQAPRVRLGTLAPRGSSFHQIIQAMGEKWRQIPGGPTLTIYPDGTMGGEADMVRRMRLGQLQAGMFTTVGLSEIDESVNALQYLPLMFRTFEELGYVREKLRPVLEQRLYDKGFVVLFWGDVGWVQFFSSEAILRPTDLRKHKIFVWAGDNRQIDIMKAHGYQPVPLETSDILAGLQTGLITAVPSTPFYALAGQFFGPAPHMLELNWGPFAGGTIISRKTWESFAPDTREALLKAAQEAGSQIRTRSHAENHQAVETMKKRGLQVHLVTPQAEEEWRRLAEEVYPKIRGSIVPAALFDEVQRLLKEYRSAPRPPQR